MLEKIRSKGGIALVCAALTIPPVLAFSTAAFAEDYFDRLQTLQDLEYSEARGGPYIKGGRSPFQARFRVCKVLPTPVKDKETGKRIKVNKEVCWFE